MAAADNFDAVFTFDNLYHSYKKCCLGVGWKASTQRYRVNAIANVNDTLRQLKEGKFKSRGFYTFIRVERGKERNIKSVHISERVVQRCLCDYSLIPILSRSFIYDNSACMAGKGIHFAVNRLVCHLQRHYRKYGKNGYALVFDFSKYFDNIEHKPLKDIIDSEYTDTRLAGLVKQLVDDFGDIGLGLGSQISQACALRYPNRLDHYIKEVLRIKGYARYMDDGYLLHESKEYLQKCLSDIKQICGELGIKLNAKKTQIIKISRGITFLQRRFVLTETGKVIIKPRPRGIVKMRRKLRVFKHQLIRAYTPRHNGKVERSHRSDNEGFYRTLTFTTFDELKDKMCDWCNRYNNRPHSSLRDRYGKRRWQTPIQKRAELLEMLKAGNIGGKVRFIKGRAA